jgi:hypothetical protein
MSAAKCETEKFVYSKLLANQVNAMMALSESKLADINEKIALVTEQISTLSIEGSMMVYSFDQMSAEDVEEKAAKHLAKNKVLTASLKMLQDIKKQIINDRNHAIKTHLSYVAHLKKSGLTEEQILSAIFQTTPQALSQTRERQSTQPIKPNNTKDKNNVSEVVKDVVQVENNTQNDTNPCDTSQNSISVHKTINI